MNAVEIESAVTAGRPTQGQQVGQSENRAMIRRPTNVNSKQDGPLVNLRQRPPLIHIPDPLATARFIKGSMAGRFRPSVAFD